MGDRVEFAALPEAAWAEFKELRLRALREEPQAFGQSHEDACSQPDALWRRRLRDAAEGRSWLVFARLDGRLVGMAGAFRSDDDVRGGRATIFGVYVDAAARGHGIGRRLLVDLLDRLAASGAVAVARLTVNARQRAAVRLYEGSGFRVVGEETATLGDGRRHRELVMQKQLVAGNRAG